MIRTQEPTTTNVARAHLDNLFTTFSTDAHFVRAVTHLNNDTAVSDAMLAAIASVFTGIPHAGNRAALLHAIVTCQAI
jgi:hypothetical protein